jgi:hypothetical protein
VSTTIHHEPVTRTEAPARPGRFVKLPLEILRDPTLSDPAKLFVAEVASYAWEALDSECYASHATLARDLGWSVQKVRRAARECRERGLIECRRTGRTNHYRPLSGERVIKNDRSEMPPVITQTDHQWYPKKRKEDEAEKSGGDVPRAAEMGTTTSTACSTATTVPEELPADDVGDVSEEDLLDRADSLILAYDLAVYDAAGGERSVAAFKAVAAKVKRGAGDLEAALGLAREGVDEVEFGGTVLYGLTKSDDFTARRLASGFRVAAKAFPSVRGQWASAPRVRCSWHSAGCEGEFIPDAAQRRLLRKLGAADLECPACQRARG